MAVPGNALKKRENACDLTLGPKAIAPAGRGTSVTRRHTR
jgi:hypothetical protein